MEEPSGYSVRSTKKKEKLKNNLLGRYGKPIYLTKERLSAFRNDPKSEVKKFTQELEQVMYQLTLNSPDWETMKLVHTVRRLYMGGEWAE